MFTLKKNLGHFTMQISWSYAFLHIIKQMRRFEENNTTQISCEIPLNSINEMEEAEGWKFHQVIHDGDWNAVFYVKYYWRVLQCFITIVEYHTIYYS